MAALLGRSLQRSLIALRAREQAAQQIAKFHQGAGGDQRRTEDERGTIGTEHPRGQSARSTALQLDEDVFPIRKLLASLNRQALSVQRVPTIVDRDYFK